MTSSALLLVGASAVQAQDAVCPESIDAFTREYEETLGAGSGADSDPVRAADAADERP